MRAIFAIFFSIIILLPQKENENFQITNGRLIWQKVFNSKMTKEDLISTIKKSGLIEIVEVKNKELIGYFRKVPLDYKGFGSSEMSTPIYINRNQLNTFVLIEFKENRYRVTIKNMQLIQSFDDNTSNFKETTELEFYALRKRNSEFKKAFLKKPAKIINYTFNKLLNFEKQVTEDKW